MEKILGIKCGVNFGVGKMKNKTPYDKFINSNAVQYHCYEASLIDEGGTDMHAYNAKEKELVAKQFNEMAERIKKLEEIVKTLEIGFLVAGAQDIHDCIDERQKLKAQNKELVEALYIFQSNYSYHANRRLCDDEDCYACQVLAKIKSEVRGDR